MFDKDNTEIFISEMNGWLFKQGSDTVWAKKNIDLTGWKKLKPTELSEKQADKNGKLEGWFRIKIKLDTAFGDKQLGFRISTWAASDFYIDGNLIAPFGNTGENGNPYQEYSPFGKFPVAVNLKAGNEYTIALHFVDYVSPIPPFRLKSEFFGLGSLISLTGQKLYPALLKNHIKSTFDITLWTSGCTVLCLLFWLLSIQNPIEKNIRLIAIYSTFFVLLTLNMAGFNLIDISYIEWHSLIFLLFFFLGC